MADPIPEQTVVPINLAVAGAIPDTGAASKDGQGTFRVGDIQLCKKDSRGIKVTYIYAMNADQYSIYQAGEVMIQFADDPAKAALQRKCILPVSSARAEINFLVQGLKCRPFCERQVAYALQLALDGDLAGANTTIAAAKSFLLTKRAARGRFQYLKWSFGTAGLMIGLLCVIGRFFPFQDIPDNLWLAGKAGLVGAAFSIALEIRNRTVALDIELLDNVTDGTLRLLIGVISAGVLLLLLNCGVLSKLQIGEANFSGPTATWQMVLVVGFLAGFLERLVPDLLDKKNPSSNGSGESSVPSGQ